MKQYMLNTIVSGINKVSEWGESRMIPDLVRQVTEKEQVGIVFYNSTGSAMFVYVCSKTANSLSRGNSMSEKSLGKGFKQGGIVLAFQIFLRIISVWVDMALEPVVGGSEFVEAEGICKLI
jgi:hypothetical protein